VPPMSGDRVSRGQANEEMKYPISQKQSNTRDSHPNLPVTSQTKSGLPATLYERLGGEEGMKIFIDKIFTKVMDDKALRPFFSRQGMDLEKIKQHFGLFMTHITSTTEAEWTGRSLVETHRHYPITDEIFDAFNSHCISSVKEMRKLKIDGLREMINMLQQLRDMVVVKDEP